MNDIPESIKILIPLGEVRTKPACIVVYADVLLKFSIKKLKMHTKML